MMKLAVIFYVYLIILVICKIFLTKSIKKKNTSFNIRNYHIFYADKKMDDDRVISSKLLYSRKYNLKGKPDYILKHDKKDIYIPVELKSGSIKDAKAPHKGDLLQLATYFLIIEDEYNYKPKYGKIIYSDYMFIIKNKKIYKKEVLDTVYKMRVMLNTGKSSEVSASFNKCKHCVCNGSVCEVC